MAKLKRELGLTHVTIAGIGIILGAGIYALIGIAAGQTGNSIWLGFLIASVVAAFTGLSYAELSTIFKGDGGEYDYTKPALGKTIAYIIAIIIIFTGFVSAAAVALGFAGYLSALIPINYLIAGIGLILIMTFLNYWGIKDSNRFNIIATTIEFLGLVIIIILGIVNLDKLPTINLLSMPNGFVGVLKAGALLFFAFMGFETIIKLREETKNPEKTIPKAIIISVFVTAIVYVLVAIAAVVVMPSAELAGSESPLADVAAQAFGNNAFLALAIIALFSTANTVLLIMLTTSRMMYGMAKQKSLPKGLGRVSKKRHTPTTAVIITGILTIAFALFGNLKLVADITNLLLFATFATINLAAIILRYKMPGKREFRMPLNIGKFPLLALLGFITATAMFVFSMITLF